MVADIAVAVALEDQGHTNTFDVSGHGSNVYQVVSEENWEIALDRAVKNFYSNFQQEMASHLDQAHADASELEEQ